jgi:Alginate lyase
MTGAAVLAGLSKFGGALALSGLQSPGSLDLAALERTRVLKAANAYLNEEPVTVTASHSDRSAGGPHDYFSEGDYWWPDPKNPGGPYIRRDGLSNPENFTEHRRVLLRFSVQFPALVAAWMVTGEKRYAEHAVEHLRAWFLAPETRMNPNLQYAQAIHGISEGRGIGIIDTIHLVEVVRGISVLEQKNVLASAELEGIREWFRKYLDWMVTSKNGKEERAQKNNHGTCWVMQAAEFSHFTRNESILSSCREEYKNTLVPNQIAANGSFPLELARTKPYSYSLFNLDVMATVCEILSTEKDNLWQFQLPDGRGIRKAVQFMYPWILDKKRWPYPPDVEYFNDLPVRQPSLLFAGLAYSDSDYIKLWKTLNPDPTVEEIIRNFPIRQPLLWRTSV